MPRTAEHKSPPAIAGWPVDAHVHLHDLSKVAETLDAAATHFDEVWVGRKSLLGCLMLTQMADEQVFEALAEQDMVGGWRLQRLEREPETLMASNRGRSVALICGRQVRAEDGLEIAALGTLERFPDGRPFEESLDAVLASDAITAIPWGFGKWLGVRGQRVEAALKRHDPRQIFLGDSGARSRGMREPGLIRRARARGVRVLAGSDPFPFAADCKRVGGFGFLAQIEPNPARPLHALRAWLRAPEATPELYGQPSTPLRFLVNQLGVQVHNRRAQNAAV
jgi:hypothetical protein